MGKLLMLAYYFPPSAASGTFRSLGFVRNLVQIGWQVQVLSASRYLAESRDAALLEKVPAGVELRYAPVYDPFALWEKLKGREHREGGGGGPDAAGAAETGRRPSGLSTLKDQATRLLKVPDNAVGWLLPALLAAARMSKPDLIYSSAPPFTSHLVGCLLKKLWRVPLVTDFRDPWGGNPFRPAFSGAVGRWDSYLERSIFKNSDLIIANTEKMGQGFMRRYPEYAGKIRVITNGYDLEDFAAIEARRMEDSDKLLLVHPGSLYGNRNPLNFLRAVNMAVKWGCTRLRIKLIGPCEEFEGKPLARHIRELGLDDYVQLCPAVGHREILELMKGADGLLLFSQGTDLQVPAKLFEYLALEKQILAVCENGSATRDILSGLPGHHFLAGNEVDEIARAVMAFHAPPLPRKAEAAAASNPFERSFLTRRLSGYLQELMASEVR